MRIWRYVMKKIMGNQYERKFTCQLMDGKFILPFII